MSERREEYLKKFRDPRWQKKRLAILERDGWTCQICFDNESTLNVHHRFYIFGNDPWEYDDASLVTLCETCHECETEEMKHVCSLLLRELKQKFFADELLEIASGFNAMTLQHIPGVVASALGWALANDGLQDEIIRRYFEYLDEHKPSYAARLRKLKP